MLKYILFTTRVKNILAHIEGASYHKLPPLRAYVQRRRPLEVNYCFPALEDHQVVALKLVDVLEPAGRRGDLAGVALAVPEEDHTAILNLIAEYKEARAAERDPARLEAIMAKFDRDIGEARELLATDDIAMTARRLGGLSDELLHELNRPERLTAELRAEVKRFIAAHDHPVAP